jgi:hypothetical protein
MTLAAMRLSAADAAALKMGNRGALSKAAATVAGRVECPRCVVELAVGDGLSPEETLWMHAFDCRAMGDAL